MSWRTVGAIALIVVGVGAVSIAVFGPTLGKSQTTQYITSQAATTNVVDQAVADGTLAAARTYGLSFGADPHLVDSSSSSSSSGSGSGSGTWLVSQVNVKVGQQVNKGDVLATADTTDQHNALDLAQANLAAAQAKSDADNGGPTSTDQQSAQISIQQAQQQLDSAKTSRDNTHSQNAIKLQQAQDSLTTARQQLHTDRKNNAPSTVITADKQNVTQAQSNLQLTKTQIDASNQQADQQVSSAQLALQSAQNNASSATAPASAQTIAADKASLLQAQQAVDDAQQTLAGATITAPVAGTIVAVNVVAGADAPSTDALQLMTSELDVTADFAESDIVNLAVGQNATVTVSATGDQVPGTVTEIEPVAATSGNSSVVSYAVTVALQDPPAKLLPGMSSQVAVTITEADNVVAVPAIALVGGNGNYSVRLLNSDGSVTVQPVQVGLITSSLAEIKSGVSAGDEVVTGTASSLNSTSGTGTNGFPGGGITGGGGNFPGGFQRGGGPTVVNNGR
jgi:HlyD family secretion protein